MIEIEQLTKQFGDLRAVNDVSLTVPTGEFFVILGPNAAGKTTTIKVMAGLMKPTSGAVRICEFDCVTDPLEARRRLAYVPDFPFLYDKLTPAEFFRFTGKLFGMEDAAMEAEAGRLAKRFHLDEFLAKPIESLSHGVVVHHPLQAQRGWPGGRLAKREISRQQRLEQRRDKWPAERL